MLLSMHKKTWLGECSGTLRNDNGSKNTNKCTQTGIHIHTHTHIYLFFLNEKYKFYSQIVYLIKDIPKSTQRGTPIYPSKHTQMHVNEDGRLD